MKISELQPKQGNVEISGEVTEKGDVRTFEKFGRQGRVCNAKIRDDSGEVALSLWNEDIDKVNIGDKIHLTNGYVGEWQGELQLTTGRFGKIEFIEQSTGMQKPGKTAEKTERRTAEAKKEIFSNQEPAEQGGDEGEGFSDDVEEEEIE